MHKECPGKRKRLHVLQLPSGSVDEKPNKMMQYSEKNEQFNGKDTINNSTRWKRPTKRKKSAIGGRNKDEFRQLVLVERGEVVLLNLEGSSQRLAFESGKTLKLLNKLRHLIVFLLQLEFPTKRFHTLNRTTMTLVGQNSEISPNTPTPVAFDHRTSMAQRSFSRRKSPNCRRNAWKGYVRVLEFKVWNLLIHSFTT